MSISAAQRDRLATWLAVMVFGAFAGYAYTSIAYDTIPEEILRTWPGVRAGVIISGASSAFELFALRGAFGRWFNRRYFLQSLLLRVIAHTAIVVGCLLANRTLSGLLVGEFVANAFDLTDIARDTIYSFVVVTFAMFVMQMRSLIGGRTLANVMLGRYRRPFREDRIFVVLDLVGSTSLAHQIGDERFHEFLAAFFYELDAAVTDWGGEICSYVGDAMIVSWPMRDAGRNARAVEAVAAAHRRIEEQGDWFQSNFGQEPAFRAALHGGAVVTGECGDSRRQITYLGDVLNMTARLEALAKQLGIATIISDTLLAAVDLPAGATARGLGTHSVKGAPQPIGVAALQFQ